MSKKIFLFPGQGSQYVGMAKNLVDNFKVAKEIFQESDDVLKMKLQKLCFEGPEQALTLTQNTQPALLATSVATFKVLSSETGLHPDLFAGHSLGEYSALVASEALSFSDGLKAVQFRGQAMQKAVPVGQGAMAALIGCEAQKAKDLCQQVTQRLGGNEVVVPANFNGGGQVVVSGSAKAVSKVVEEASTAGIRRAILLQVSAPFHSPLMKPAADQMATFLETVSFQKPKVPYIKNIDATINKSADSIKDALVKQIPSAVQWEASMQLLKDQSITHAYEVGAGKVLTGLLHRINKEITGQTVQTAEDIKLLASS